MEYKCEGACSVEKSPSPKFHKYEFVPMLSLVKFAEHLSVEAVKATVGIGFTETVKVVSEGQVPSNMDKE